MSTTRKSYEVVKRGVDILGAGFGLVLLSPIIAVVAIAVQLRLGSPVIFRQERAGLNGQSFTMLKFRTMVEFDESRRLVTDEERLTPFGLWLRASSLDELPSLVNVIVGDMSLVGPRPLLVDYLELYTPEQARRHEMRPGLTGLAQTRGRNSLSWEEKFALDIEYVDSPSLANDLRILMWTFGTVLRREGIGSRGQAVGVRFLGSQTR